VLAAFLMSSLTFDATRKTIMSRQRLLPTLLFVLAATVGLDAQAQDRRPEYQLGPGDTVRIAVYQNPDLTLETRVTENGNITFPLIGVVKIGGMTIAAAELTIANALKSGGFIKQPQVNIVPVQLRSNQVSVLGQVGRPGRFPLEIVNTRLSEAIAMAGGIAAAGADTVILTGVRDGQSFRKEIDISGMFLDNKLQDDVVVSGGDVIYVHRMPMFYIYGEVQKPGSYRLERGMTIRQALAQGGGPTVRGTERRLKLFRRSGNGVAESSPNLNSLVRPDDVLYVGESLF
jgi:polysaccharide export outer membrane protein